MKHGAASLIVLCLLVVACSQPRRIHREGGVDGPADSADVGDAASPDVSDSQAELTLDTPVSAETTDLPPAADSPADHPEDAAPEAAAPVDVAPEVATCSSTCAAGVAPRCGPTGGTQTCQQAGACTVWGQEQSCSPYRCTAGVCLRNCRTSAECDGAYECSADNVCISRCRQQTDDNMLPNAGLDLSAAGWTFNEPAPARAANWDPFIDASTCPTSGSLKVQGTSAVLSPVLTIHPGSLTHIGYLVERDIPDMSIAPCTILWCKTQPCQQPAEIWGTDEVPTHGLIPGSTWERAAGDFQPLSVAVGARIMCGIGAGNHRYDHFYWSLTRSAF